MGTGTSGHKSHAWHPSGEFSSSLVAHHGDHYTLNLLNLDICGLCVCVRSGFTYDVLDSAQINVHHFTGAFIIVNVILRTFTSISDMSGSVDQGQLESNKQLGMTFGTDK